MKISKKDALTWFRFFAELPEEEPLGCRQQEIALAVFSQIETAVEARRKEALLAIPGLKAVVPGRRTPFPGRRIRRPARCSWGRKCAFPAAAAAACWARGSARCAKPTNATWPARSAMTTACWTASHLSQNLFPSMRKTPAGSALSESQYRIYGSSYTCHKIGRASCRERV